MAIEPLAPLTRLLAKLPGLGPRSSRRALIYLLENKESILAPLTRELENALSNIQTCTKCGNLDIQSPCHICQDPLRDGKTICVVESVADIWALEKNVSFKGHFHSLGGTLSAIDGVGPDDIQLNALFDRAQTTQCSEVILALSATIDGQTTSHYIANELKGSGIKITAIAHGIPVGGELDYLDEGTLSTALKSRRAINE